MLPGSRGLVAFWLFFLSLQAIPVSAATTESTAFARDPAGNFWVVADELDCSAGPDCAAVNFRIEKYGPAGVFISSTPLPGATDEGLNGIAFDASADAWVCGTTSDGGPARVTVWKVSSSGSALLSSGTYADAPQAALSGGITIDAQGNVWVAGSVQPAPPRLNFKFALWKFGPDANLISGFPVFQQRPGGTADAGRSAAVDPDGRIWSAGVSQNPATGRLDLALWKYDVSINAFAANFPVYWPDAFFSLEEEANAGLAISPTSGAVWVAASKSALACAEPDFALLAFDASGVQVSTSFWRPQAALGAQARAVTLGPDGNVWTAGLVEGAQSTAALWKHGPDGTLFAGYPVTTSPSFSADGIAIDAAGDPWVVYGSTPTKLVGTTPVAGEAARSACAFAPVGAIAGFITTALAQGTAFSVVASTKSFLQENPFQFVFTSTGGFSSPFALSLPAPATYMISAFEGSSQELVSTATRLGSYNHFAEIPLADGQNAGGVDFPIVLDAVPPTAAFTEPVSGSTLTALDFLRGTAADNVRVEADLDLALHDQDLDLWWDRNSRQWVSTTTVPYFFATGGRFTGHPENAAWQAAVSTSIQNFGFGGGFAFNDKLARGHRYRVHANLRDFVGNETPEPASAVFVWNGAQGDVLAPSPSFVSGQALGTSSIAWTWGLVQNVTSYALFNSTYGAQFAATSANSFVETGLSTNTPRYFCVASINAFGAGDKNCSQTTATLAVAAGRPVASSVGFQNIVWTWDRGENPEFYTFYALTYSTDNFQNHVSATINTNFPAAQTGDLAPDTVYYARVQALNFNQIPDGFSETGSTRTLPGPPDIPVNLTASFDQPTRTNRLAWDPAPAGFAAATYSVYRGVLQGGTTVFFGRAGALVDTSYTDFLEQSATYFYRVTGVNAFGIEGPPSVEAAVASDVNPPALVGDLRIVTARPELGEVDLAWTAPQDDFSGVVRYVLAASTVSRNSILFGSGISSVSIPSTVSPGSTVTFTAAASSTTTTFFALRAFDAFGNESGYSNFAALDLTPPRFSPNLSQGQGIFRPLTVNPGAFDDVELISVAFLVDGATLAVAAAPPYSFFWDTRGHTDGDHVLLFRARDAAGNEAELRRDVILSYTQPNPPIVFSPQQDFITKVATINVTGIAENGTTVQVMINGLDLATAAVVNGSWGLTPATLPFEGDHVLTAVASEARGFSSPSFPVIGVFSTRAAGPPAFVSATGASGGKVVLAWSAPAGKAPSFYRVYRSTNDIDLAPSGAAPAHLRIADRIKLTKITDSPAIDDLYYYGVTSDDGAGNESGLSDIVFASSDRVLPSAAVDMADAATSQPLGPGVYRPLFAINEPLSQPPIIVFTPALSQSQSLNLEALTATLWRATVTITAETPSGAAVFSFQGKDLAGNIGKALSSATVALDTIGPLGNAALSKASPLSTGPLTIALSFDEPAVTTPTFTFTAQGRSTTSLSLTQTGARDGRSWSATVEISAATGEGLAGLAGAATDRVGNVGTSLGGETSFVIDTIAPGPPVLVRANPLPGGHIKLSWSGPGGERPAFYHVYRDGVLLSTRVVPAPDGSGSYTDTPSEGEHSHQVSSLDLAGNESSLSDPISVADATPPPPPFGLAAGINTGGQILLDWESGSTDTVKFSLYRTTFAITSVAGLPSRNAVTPFLDTPDQDGIFHYVVTGLDFVGNESAPSNEALILFDKSAPKITVTGVTNGGFFNTDVFPRFSAVDGNLDPSSLRGFLDDAVFASGATVSAEGPHALRVDAADTEGHASAVTVNFTIDKTAPEISIPGFSDGAVFLTSVAAHIQATDLRLKTSSFFLLNETLATGAAYVSGAAIVRDGFYRLTATASDLAGNASTKTVSFRVDVAPLAPVSLSALIAGSARLSWLKPEPDVHAYRVYRDGSRISSSLHPDTAFEDAGFVPGAHVYEVSAVDVLGAEGPRARATIPDAALTLTPPVLTRGFFDLIKPSVANATGAPLLAGPALIELVTSAGVVAKATAPAVSAPAGQSAALEAALAVPVSLPDAVTIKVTATLPTDPGAVVRLVREFPADSREPLEPILEVFPDALIPGTQSPVQVKLYNRGSAPMDVITAEFKNSTFTAVNDVQVRLKTAEGTALGSAGLKQTRGASTTLVANRQVFFVTLPPGSSYLFDPIRVLVPNTVLSGITVEALVSTPAFNLPFIGLAGTRGFASAVASGLVKDVPYRATAQSDRAVYDQGSTMGLTGRAFDINDFPIPNAAVEVHVVKDGFDRHVRALTDSSGTYSAVFSPSPYEAGVYSLFASHPDVVTHAALSSFTIVGFAIKDIGYDRILTDFSAHLAQNSSFGFQVRLANTGATALEGLRFSSKTFSGGEGLTLTLDPASFPSRLEGGAVVTLKLTAAASPAASSGTLHLTISESNGFSRTLPVIVQVSPAVVLPSVSPQQFSLGLLAGEIRTQAITLQNKGFDTWRGVSLSSPALDWVKLQGLPDLGNILPGGNASFTLSFEPPPGLPTGTYAPDPLLLVSSLNAAPIPIQAGVTVTSSRKGDVLVSVIDADKPRNAAGQGSPLAGAVVTLASLDVTGLNPKSVADLNGLARLTAIPSGRYAWRAEAKGYQTANGTVVVEPGLSNQIEALLVTAVITYEWSVTPTTIVDRYEITLDVTFRTDVPAPRVIIDPPNLNFNMEAGQVAYGQYTVRNEGLVSAFNFKLNLAGDPAMKVETPFSEIAELKAGQSVSVPVKVTLLSASCHSFNISHFFDYICLAGTLIRALAQWVGITAGNTCGVATVAGPVAPATGGGGGGSGYIASGGYVSLAAPSANTGPKCAIPDVPDPLWVAPRSCSGTNPAKGDRTTPGTSSKQGRRSLPLSFSPIHNTVNPKDGIAGFGWSEPAGSMNINADNSVTLKGEDGSEQVLIPLGPLNQLINGSGPQFARPVDSYITLGVSDCTQSLYTCPKIVGCEQKDINLADKDGTVTVYREAVPRCGELNALGPPKGAFLPVAMTDRNGNTVSYDRTTGSSQGHLGKVKKMSDNHGRTLTFTYNAQDKIASAEDQAGRVYTYGYDAQGNKVSEKDANGDPTLYAYDANHRITEITYPSLGKTVFTYDAQGRVLTETDDLDNNKMTYEYFFSSTAVTDALGRITVYDWTEKQGLRKITKIRDPQGGITSFDYDANMNLTSQTDPLGRTTRFHYDGNGNVLATTDPANQTTQLAYEPKFNQATLISDPKANKTQLIYDAKGNLTSVQDAQNNFTAMSYDAGGHVTQTKDPLGQATNFGYTNASLTSVTDPLGRTTSMQRDALNRVTRNTDPKGKITAFAYDPENNLTQVKDAINGITAYAYERGRPSKLLKTVTDAKNQATTFGYDVIGRLTSVTNALNQAKGFSYDNNGNLTSVTDAKGQTISFHYDSLSRLTRKVLPDFPGTPVAYEHDLAGNITKISHPIGSMIEMSFDALNRKIREVQTLPGGFKATLTWEYDANGNKTAMTATPGGRWTYAYDSLNRLTRITNPEGSIFTFAYDALGRRTKLGYPNGIEATYAFDAASQVTQLLHRKTSNNTAIAFANYAHDAAGNRISMEDIVGTHGYVYDDLHRLVSATHPPVSNIPTKNETFSHDAVGNRLADARFSGYQYDAANRLLSNSSFTFTHDANGNLTEIKDKLTLQATSYTNDSENQLRRAEMPNGTIFTTKYDGQGRRIEKSSGPLASQTQRFIYDNEDVVAMLDGNNNLISIFTHGPGIDEPLMIKKTGGTEYFLHADRLGSIVAVTNTAGDIVETVDYEAYGKAVVKDRYGAVFDRSTVDNPYLFTAREYEETGLYFFRSRYYDPTLGRFLQEDPIGLIGSINTYSYAYLSPVNFNDPFGLKPGDPYPSLNRAAIAAITDINPQSIIENVEYAGRLYRNPDGTYSYTAPIRGTVSSSDPGSLPVGKISAGDYHTHGGPDSRFESESFSPADKQTNDGEGIPGYLGTPSGKILKYIPNPKKQGKGKIRTLKKRDRIGACYE